MMRNGRTFFLYIMLLITTTIPAVAQTTAGHGQKTLIVYFSRVGSSRPFAGVDAVSSASLPQGNTIVMAKMVHDVVGGDMFQVVTVNPYPAAYPETTDLALKEQNAGARPRLATHVPNMDDYDVIFLGYPNWWGTLPMALFTFLEEYDLAGKTIIPFCTHEGSQLGRSIEDIRKLEPRANLREGLAARGGSVDRARGDVGRWLSKLGYK
jgi:flavodoxin